MKRWGNAGALQFAAAAFMILEHTVTAPWEALGHRATGHTPASGEVSLTREK